MLETDCVDCARDTMIEVKQNGAVFGLFDYLDSITTITHDRVAGCDDFSGTSWNKLGWLVSFGADDLLSRKRYYGTSTLTTLLYSCGFNYFSKDCIARNLRITHFNGSPSNR